MAETVPKESLISSVLKGDHSSSSSSSSSSDSDTEDRNGGVKEIIKTKVFRLFGRERPVHHVLGGGQISDVLLWRNKKISGGVVGIATLIWLLFEVVEYHLLTLICHCLMSILSILFIWFKISSFVSKSSGEHFLEVSIPEDAVIRTAKALSNDINRALSVLRDIASGREFKKFVGVILGLWILSIIGSKFSFLTLFYIDFILLHTLPVLYEKYDDKVDVLAEKGMVEIKKVFVTLEAKFSSKIPKGNSKYKKHD
ncbi:Reticulon family protein [Zostera marina]|uniref:Reticulon-like protein n=1 Tax=Zostera marina TaxID=29655 RepID=A0A0K9NU98_ZOSMR|nr:Reticulon family protein [Zostera marina]